MSARQLIPSEDEEQRFLLEWMAMFLRDGCVYWHTPNGGSRNIVEATKFKKLGVMPGIPDVFIFRAGMLHAIELKRAKRSKSKLTHEQVEMHWRLAKQGALVAVCYGADEAIKQLNEWDLVKE